MSSSQDKKIRQLYRRDFAKNLKKFQMDVARMVRPAPRWFPSKLWFRLQRIFLNFD